MNTKNKIILILVLTIIILLVTCIAIYRTDKQSGSYHEQVKSMAKNIIDEIL